VILESCNKGSEGALTVNFLIFGYSKSKGTYIGGMEDNASKTMFMFMILTNVGVPERNELGETS